MLYIFLGLVLLGFMLIYIGNHRYNQGHRCEGTTEILIGIFQMFGIFTAFI